MKDKILIVDDIDINRMILSEMLCDDYEVVEAADGFEAIDQLFHSQTPPKAILLDIMMPGMDGFEVIALVKSNPETEKIPVLFITASDANINESKGLKAGAVDYISKPFNPDVVKARLENHIQLTRYRSELEALVEKKTADLTSTYEQTLETLASIIEYRDLESGTHIRRTSMLTKILIGQMLPMSRYRETLINAKYLSIIKAAALHDIGKVGIPDEILLKPGRLTEEEFETMKTHATIGAKIMETISSNLSDDDFYLKHCCDICRTHHERWDGKGYPDGKAGESIPLTGRMLAIVDVYDALVNARCYKPKFSHEEAVELMMAGSGTQFDPELIEVFLAVQDKFRELEESMGDEVVEKKE